MAHFDIVIKMTGLDWTVLLIYIGGMIALSVYLGRDQEDQEDYYVGGRSLPWWAVGISTMATQSSAISFISIPAFVALREGGGMTWLQYELAVPLAMMFIMAFLLPFFRKLELVSIYEYLEMRFGPGTRYFLSGVFLISRGFGTGVGVYATALVLSAMLGLSLTATILLIGVVTIIYDTIGGMKAVVYSDVIQMFVLLIGVSLAIMFAVDIAGGFGAMFTSLPQERWNAMDPSWGFGESGPAPFWAYLIGGFFLYSSYYGADQSQVQRELSTPSIEDTQRSLLFNGIARFPLTLLYISLGLAVGAAYIHSPELRSAVPSDHLDYLVPKFILIHLPAGIRGLILAAILSAAMSSLDSGLNSLSASFMRDFVERGRKLTREQTLRFSKISTVGWGIVVTGSAFLAGNISKTVVEAINKLGSAFYGPVLATFLLGVLSRSVNSMGVVTGVVLGVMFNMTLWIVDAPVHWMWWNAFGFVVTIVSALAVSALGDRPAEAILSKTTLAGAGMLKTGPRDRVFYISLALYFFFILSVVVASRLLV